MKRIQQLSRQLINQIAAGEVIERPASVVKELVENSIDAGATRIEIEVSKDCLSLRVADNGAGIHPDDIELAFSKHATSKISTADDLFDIHTMGFRGEALASIISIAKVVCTTRTKDFETGTRVECEESNVKSSPAACAIGTTMEVNDLFYNTPVRQKFLKSEKVELSYISEALQSIAISHPEIAITLIYDGKTPVKTSGSGDLLCVLTEIYSNSIAGELKKINKKDELSHLHATGFCSTPDFTRSSKKSVYVFVNNRVVKCPVILKAIDTAYKNMLPAGKYPFVCLNLSIPAKDVDVNVHPTKKEVRYQNPNQIFNFIYSSILGALADIKVPQKEEPDIVIPFGNYNTLQTTTQDGVSQDKEDDDTVYVSSQKFEEIQETNTPPASRQFELNIKQIDLDIPKVAQVEETFNIIGQYQNTYIIFEEDTELKIVDQHIADERYIFEKLQANLKKEDIHSQLLLISDVLQLEAADIELIQENSEKLKHFGYEIQKVSDTEIIFKKVPQVISHIKVKDILSDILENLHGDLNNLEEKMLVTMSCKAAVKAGTELNHWQMEELIKKWKTTKLPYTCPHGRPIVHTFSEKEIASFFHRNV
ncbi:MAG TPA: DNA mismatch repair endonuclease MutL [Candidatus Limenecus avicola]|mgnify:FL=1|uniref:DNA mismatch repair protein MutL n=1 Tax=Candidatus Limenecus avicola TaxID=2840847 RepID=A0A9D1N0X8_9CLOT|nr:DNA mismatch repair endonuclease MutL [Candidatus Limenecus avicola]